MEGRILISGGSGFLGRGILRRAAREDWPSNITVYSRDELKQAQCRKKYPDARYVLGDVRDTERLKLVLLGVDTVIHTAALKYVPEGEHNVSECISVNVDGTASVLRAAHEAGVRQVVCISTDKAVAPANVYGATKMLVERMVGEAATWETVKVTAVRYGNVLGSSGSVVPVMQAQANECGYVNVTNPDMTRYWLGVETAIDLILMALSPRVRNGAVVVLNPKSMVLSNLVRAVAPTAEQRVVGVRPGEKMHETLLTESEAQWARFVSNDHDIVQLEPLHTRERSGFAQMWTSEHALPMSIDECRDIVEDAATV